VALLAFQYDGEEMDLKTLHERVGGDVIVDSVDSALQDHHHHHRPLLRTRWGIGGGWAGVLSFKRVLVDLHAFLFPPGCSLQVGIPVDHMKPLMHSLACGKYKFLKKTPPGDKIKETDKFAINPSFTW
jgi:hypothetical protein